MFRVSNGKFIGKNVAFIPPDNFLITVRQSEFSDNGFKFISLDGSNIRIQPLFSENCIISL